MSTQPDVAGRLGRPRSPADEEVTIPWPRPAGTGTEDGAVRVERWQQRFARLVAASDLAIIASTVAASMVAGITGVEVADRALVISGSLAGVLMVTALAVTRAWDARMLGGTEELKRLGRATILAAVVLGLGGLAVMVDSVRPWVFAIMPIAGGLCLIGRFVLRKWLHHQRTIGRCTHSVLAVGDVDTIADLVRRTRRDPYFGWRVDGACTPTGRGAGDTELIDGVPVVGDLDDVSRAVRSDGYRIVAVSQAPGWGPARLQRLAWQLEGTEADLAVDPGLMEIAGPRMHITPIDGLPLLRLSKPRFTGAGRLLKAALDRSFATLLLILTAPVFVVIGIAIRCGDGGPVFFTQERVSANGRTFRMVKFRSMCVDAEARIAALRALDEGAGPLFKLRSDPRVTRVGAVLRKYSLDELPQLLNVLTGSMSLVGPRPPLPGEVATYAVDARRRLLVRPGMTGLWQVSGRSSLSWEETVRLDLRYVENWSMALDAIILWKTIGAVVRSRGAY